MSAPMQRKKRVAAVDLHLASTSRFLFLTRKGYTITPYPIYCANPVTLQVCGL